MVEVLYGLILILMSCFVPPTDDDDEHPTVEPKEKYSDYLARTEQYWIQLARTNLGSEAKEKKVLKVGHAMAKTFYEFRD